MREILVVDNTIRDTSPKIARSIEFPPGYKQAGTSILNYFGEVLEQKYPDKDVKVRIEQHGLKVTMVIESALG